MLPGSCSRAFFLIIVIIAIVVLLIWLILIFVVLPRLEKFCGILIALSSSSSQ